MPPPEIRGLRDLTRTRLQVLKDRTREWQRLEKLLEGALVKLSSAAYSIPGPRRPRASWRPSSLASARDPKALAPLTHGNIKGGSAAIKQSLEGMLLAAGVSYRLCK